MVCPRDRSVAFAFDFINGFHDARTPSPPSSRRECSRPAWRSSGRPSSTSSRHSCSHRRRQDDRQGPLRSRRRGLPVILGAPARRHHWNLITWWLGLPHRRRTPWWAGWRGRRRREGGLRRADPGRLGQATLFIVISPAARDGVCAGPDRGLSWICATGGPAASTGRFGASARFRGAVSLEHGATTRRRRWASSWAFWWRTQDAFSRIPRLRALAPDNANDIPLWVDPCRVRRDRARHARREAGGS